MDYAASVYHYPGDESDVSGITSATWNKVVDPDSSKKDFMHFDDSQKSLTIGKNIDDTLGAAWFKETRSVGGTTDFCIDGRCQFGRGIRVFFTLEYSGSGDGLIFSLINGTSNSNSSIGGDIGAAELLGYSGDGRLDAGGTQFIPGSTKNLNPPKIGLEFDAKVNYDYQDEQALKYCDGSSLNACTRNDPGSSQSSVCDNTSNSSGTKDAVQYVFWGNSSLNILCRGNNPSYDDNRHNASGSGSRNWAFNTTWDINSSPALAPDGTIYAGTIYIGSDSTNFYAVNPDGLERWHIDISGFWYSPTVSKTGRIYVGSSDKKLYAIEDNGNSASILWTFDTRNKGTVNGGAITTKPAISNNGDTIFFGCDDGFFYAVSSGGNEIWRFDTNSIFGLSQIKTSPALSPPPGPSTNENYVYFGSTRGVFYANRTDNGGGLWSVTISAGIRSSPAVRSSDGVVYVGADNGDLYAFNGTTGNPPVGSNFPFNAGSSAITSSPAVDSNGTVYFGYGDHKLYAIGGSTGSKIWDFTTGGIVASSPAIDSNNHIYFGSNDKKIYALYNDGTLKWSISTLNIGPGGDVKGRPAVQVDGTVYTGCSDFRLYSINQFANPKNFKDKLITYDTNKVGGEPVVVDSTDDWLKGASSKGPWAVRMEVIRNLLDPSNGTYAYSLKTWLRQCSRPDCSDTTANDPLGTFFEDTRIEYSPPTHLPQLAQPINILEGTPSVFERFLFGFTSQTASGDVQTATIRNFKLSFIRPNDPIVTVDPNWP
jgi:outer membrane protein assembly factor BamB